MQRGVRRARRQVWRRVLGVEYPVLEGVHLEQRETDEPDALIAMATLTRGRLRPPLPGRS